MEKKCKIILDERIKHLTESEIETLMHRYYEGENVKKLTEEYGISINPSRLFSIFPPIISNDKICPNCGSPIGITRQSKSSHGFTKSYEYCINCKHNNVVNCACEYCVEERKMHSISKEEQARKLMKDKRELIEQEYNVKKHEKVALENLSFLQKVYLGALLRLALSEDMSRISPLNNFQREISPTSNFTKEIMVELIHNRIILVDPQSPIDAFVDSPKDSEFPKVYYLYNVGYVLNLISDNDSYAIMDEMINPKEIDEKFNEGALLLWKKIALEECLEYLNYQMEKVRFNYNAGDKTISVIRDLLDHFSVSQIYGIIYKSIANATKWYQEANVTKKQAANSVIGNCQRYGERAIIGKWDLTKYSRIAECPQSMVSEFFHNRVIGIGDLGFHLPPISL